MKYHIYDNLKKDILNAEFTDDNYYDLIKCIECLNSPKKGKKKKEGSFIRYELRVKKDVSRETSA